MVSNYTTIIDECFPALPDDFGRVGKGFQPYSYRVGRAREFLQQNALPLLALIVSVVG